ncbi:MAG: Host cell factor 2 [Paramarteilia canceri]
MSSAAASSYLKSPLTGFCEQQVTNDLNRPSARYGHRSVSLANRFLIVYGGALANGELDDQLYVFDSKNYEWTPLGCFSKTKGRSMHSSIEMKGNIFVFGGWITVENDDVKEGISLTTGAIGTFNENLKPNHFENHLDSNSQDFPKPQISLLPRANHSSSNIGNRVYFFGGKTCLVNTNSNNKLSNDLKSTINDNFSYLDIGPPEKFLEIKNLKAEPLSITLNLNQEGDITSVYVFLTTDTSEETLQNIPDEYFVYDPLKLSYKPLVPGKSYRLTIIPKNNYSIGSQKIHHVSTLPANINPIFAFKKLKANGEILEISWIHRRDYDIYYKIFAVPLSFDNNCIENFDKPYLVYEGSDTRCRIPYETLKEISYRTSLGLLLRLAFNIFGAESKDVLYKIETTFHVY